MNLTDMTDKELLLIAECHAKEIAAEIAGGRGYRDNLQPLVDRLAELVSAMPERPKQQAWALQQVSNQYQGAVQAHGPFVIGAPQ